MANNCDVELIITGKADGLRKIAELISKNGGIMSRMVESVEKGKSQSIYARGDFYMSDIEPMLSEIESNMDKYGISKFQCDYEGAWSAQRDVHDFFEEYYQEYGIRFNYREIEPGCNVFTTNSSKLFPEKYYVEFYAGNDTETDVFMNIKAVASYLNEKNIPNLHINKCPYSYDDDLETAVKGVCMNWNWDEENNKKGWFVNVHRIEVV